MKVIEVQFDGHVRMPDSMRATNVLRTVKDVSIGSSIMVDSLDLVPQGIVATKTVEKDKTVTTYRKLYAWNCVNEVVYEPEVIKSDSSHSLPAKEPKK